MIIKEIIIKVHKSCTLFFASIFLAHVDSCHFLSTSAFSQALRTVPERAEWPSFKCNLVRCSCLKLITLRATPLDGPSTKALKKRISY